MGQFETAKSLGSANTVVVVVVVAMVGPSSRRIGCIAVLRLEAMAFSSCWWGQQGVRMLGLSVMGCSRSSGLCRSGLVGIRQLRLRCGWLFLGSSALASRLSSAWPRIVRRWCSAGRVG